MFLKRMKQSIAIFTAVVLSLICSTIAQGSDAGNTGSIRGKVIYDGPAPTAIKMEVDKDLEVCAEHVIYPEALKVSEEGGLMNVFIQLVDIDGVVEIPESRPSLYQKGCKFTPHIQVIPAGTRMNIYNEDGIAHNIHTLSMENPSFNMQQPGKKKRIITKKTDFSIPEIIPIKCDLHSWMKAWIIVSDHPYYAISELDGSYEIHGIPAGTHTIEFWHEILGKQTQEVIVQEAEKTELNTTFKPGK